MTAVPASKDFLSIGQMAAHVQRPVRRIEQAATDLGISPALRLNGIPYFDGGAVEKITEALKGSK